MQAYINRVHLFLFVCLPPEPFSLFALQLPILRGHLHLCQHRARKHVSLGKCEVTHLSHLTPYSPAGFPPNSTPRTLAPLITAGFGGAWSSPRALQS